MLENDRSCSLCGQQIEAERKGVCLKCWRKANESYAMELIANGTIEDLMHIKDAPPDRKFMAWPAVPAGRSRCQFPAISGPHPVDAILSAADELQNRLMTEAQQETSQ